MEIRNKIANNARELRSRKGLTLDDAAKLTGVSRSMLAQIEKGSVNPTISVLWKIANGYRVSFTSLMSDRTRRSTVIRGKDIAPLTDNCTGYANYPAFPFQEDRLFETYRIRIDVGGSLEAQPHMPGTEEYITVFSGQVEIFANGEAYLLEEGDSLHFLADAPHSYRNTGADTVHLSMLLYYRPM